MRETVDVVRRLLAMEKVTFKGEFVQVEDIEIDIVHGDRSPKNVPIYIGATGMKMMELSGEIGDGVLLNYLVSPAYNREAMTHLRAGAGWRGKNRKSRAEIFPYIIRAAYPLSISIVSVQSVNS